MKNKQFLEEAFNPEFNHKWIKIARLRRNIYLLLFLTGMACIFITAFTGHMLMSILSLFLATVSLVVMTKYETQLFFLRGLKLKDEIEEETKAD